MSDIEKHGLKTYAMDITGFPKMTETQDGAFYLKEEVDAMIADLHIGIQVENYLGKRNV